MLIPTAIFWVLMAALVFFDIKRIQRQVDDGDVDAALRVPDTTTWVGIVAFLGILALPIYMYKVHRWKGLLLSIVIWIAYAMTIALLGSNY